jgi:hypothetical protein
MTSEIDIDQRAENRSGPQIVYCPQAKRLLDGFCAAVHEMVRLHKEQLRAILNSETDLSRFDLELHYAQERKENAKYAYIGHLEQHGCGKWNDEAD